MDGYGDKEARRQDARAGRDVFQAGRDVTFNIHYQSTPQAGESERPEPAGDKAEAAVITVPQLLEMGPRGAAAVLEKALSPDAAKGALDSMRPEGAAAILEEMAPDLAAPYLSVMRIERVAHAFEVMTPNVAVPFALHLEADRAGRIMDAMRQKSATALVLAADSHQQVAALLAEIDQKRALAILRAMETSRRDNVVQQIQMMTSTRALVLGGLAEKIRQEARSREAWRAEFAAREAERQPMERRLMPLTWSVRASACLLFLASILLDWRDSTEWPVRIAVILVAGWLTFATAINSVTHKFMRAAGALIALASFCAASADAIIMATRDYPLYATIPALVLAWYIGFFSLTRSGR